MAPHGKLSLQWLGDTLTAYISAPMNDEGARLIAEEIRREVNSKGLIRWKRLLVFSPNALGGPEVCRIAKANNEWCFQNGCTAGAIVISSAPQRFLYGKCTLNYKFFKSKHDGLLWLRSQ
ncbi:MAG: hypothetical protein CML20_18655 [Rheinheimera sp.]|nr:hypothetical protein [Rheinheimera sp.]|tara:strand:- start:3093 stop:3452 length:360 start_codon:yes stop_codon:yes gene_type:complete